MDTQCRLHRGPGTPVCCRCPEKRGCRRAVEAIALLVSHVPIFAVESSWFSDQFPANVRSSGISLGYNGVSLVAGLLPFLAVAAYGWIGWIGPALIFVTLGIISTSVAMFVKETTPVKTGELAKEKVAA